MASSKEAFRRLCAVAETQQGFFTAKQAVAAGFSASTHPYHARAGNWVREHRGIYRLAWLPPMEHADLALWQLWSSNRAGQVEGVYSHQTALGLHGFGDINPAKLHLTVPPHFRRSGKTPDVLAMHSADLPESDIATAQGYRFTRPLRTVLDLAAADTVPRSVLRDALLRMIERKTITVRDIQLAKIPAESRKQFEQLLSI